MNRKLLIAGGLAGFAALVLAASSSSGGLVIGSSLADLTLAEAKLDLTRGVKEEGGKDLGPEIAAYAEPFGLEPPVSWCSLAFSTWVRRAANKLGFDPPVGSPLAQEVMQQLIALNAFIPASQATPADLTPGTVVIWSREPNPNYQGHIGLITSEPDGSMVFQTIEGNSGPLGDRVAAMTRGSTYGGPGSLHTLLGLGKLDRILLGSSALSTDPQLWSRSLKLFDDEGQLFRRKQQ